MSEHLYTPKKQIQRVFAANVTTATLAPLPLADLVTQPVGDGYVDDIHNLLCFAFFGAGLEGKQPQYRISLLKKAKDAQYWVALTLLDLVTATLGTGVGLSGGFITDADRKADAVTFTGDADAKVVGDANNGFAVLQVDARGADYVFMEAAKNTATDANALVWTI